MITAEEYCRKNQNSNHPDMISKLLIGYAKEAIKADRINLLGYVTTKKEYWEGLDDNTEYTVVDKDSIINAPNIELL